MLTVDNNLFGGCSFSSLPELSPTIKRAALVTCGIVGSVFLGFQAYRYARSVMEQRVREKVADYFVIGFTRDSKLTSEELAIKGEAIAVRKRLCSILQEIGDQENLHLSVEKQKDLSELIKLLNKVFSVWDTFGSTNQYQGNLPSWWSSFEPKIKAEMLERIQVRYSDDTSPQMKSKKAEQKENLDKQIDLIFQKAQARNGMFTGLDFAKSVALTIAVNALKQALKENR